MKKRLGVAAILLLAFCGLADSLYLTQHAESGTPLLCNVQNLSECNVVAASQYSSVFGIPLAEFGVAFYVVLFILAALELVLFDQLLRRLLQGMAIVGVVFSLYFTYLQKFIINAFCIYCFASALITLLVLIVASMIEPLPRRAAQVNASALKGDLPMPPLS